MARARYNRPRVLVRAVENEEGEYEVSRHAMRSESRRVLILGIVFVLVLLWGLIVPTYITNLRVHNLPTLLEDFSINIGAVLDFLTGNPAPIQLRLCAVLVGAAGGCALGLCGSTYQGAFNNNLAAPKTLGVMGGGAAGSLMWVLWLQYTIVPQFPAGVDLTFKIERELDQWLFSHDLLGWVIAHHGAALCSVAGCFLIVGIVMLVSSLVGRGHLSNIIVIICGQVVAGAVTGIINFLRYVYSANGSDEMAQQLAEIENYAMYNYYYYGDLPTILIPIIVCIVVVLLLRNRLTLLSFGDDEARSMGMNVNRTRYLMIIICTFMTGWAISFCGHIAFLGFISAHISRKIVGPDFRFLLPASVFVGGSFITILLWLAQSGLPFTDPYAVGAMCSVIGGILFLILAFREGRRAHGSW